MVGAIGVLAVLALGSAAIFFWWRARSDRGYWIRASANAAAGGAFSLPFALAATRRLWILGLGLLLQATSGGLAALIRSARGSNSGTTSAKVLGVGLMTGTAVIVIFFVVSFFEKRKYKDSPIVAPRNNHLGNGDDA